MIDGVFEEIDDFAQFGLGLIDAGDVGEGDLGVLFDEDLGAAFTDGHQAAGALAHHRADHQEPQQQESQGGQHPAEGGFEKAGRRFAGE